MSENVLKISVGGSWCSHSRLLTHWLCEGNSYLFYSPTCNKMHIEKIQCSTVTRCYIICFPVSVFSLFCFVWVQRYKTTNLVVFVWPERCMSDMPTKYDNMYLIDSL